MDSISNLYQIEEDIDSRIVSSSAEYVIDFGYRIGGSRASGLYAKGKTQQWNSDEVLDWSLELDPDNLLSYDDRFLPIHGSRQWENARSNEQRDIRNHYQAYILSQFLHGEQLAMLAAGGIAMLAPDVAVKQFATQQALDEARHVEVFSRIIVEKVGLAYPMDKGVMGMIEQGLADDRWDFQMLTTQVLLEGLALGMLQQLRDFSKSKLISTAAGYIMSDESRHVAFGIAELEAYYRELTAGELRERTEFAKEGLHILKKRLNPMAVWKHLGFSFDTEDMRKSALDRITDRLTTRMDVMLARLGIAEKGDARQAGERLWQWELGDQNALQKIRR